MSSPTKDNKRLKRAKRTRKSIGGGTAERPRLSVFRSNQNFSAQLIDDQAGVTLAAISDIKEKGSTNIASATKLGKAIATAAKKVKITTVVFDRGGYAYHGQVKAFAEAAREAGLQF